MRFKGPVVSVLMAFSAASLGGCRGTAVVSPEAPSGSALGPSRRGGGYWSPEARRLMIPSPRFPKGGPTIPAANPWKPEVPSREWHWIVLHHTATSSGSVASINKAHLKRTDDEGNPWLGIGYHFVIGNGHGMRDGEIEPTFRWKQQLQGAHAGVREYNEHGIGIALVGNFDEQPPTRAQLAAVKRLVSALEADYGISGEQVIGHNEIKATACPGRYFPVAEISRSDLEPYVGTRAAWGNPWGLVQRKGP